MSFTQQYEVSPLTFDDLKKKLVDLLAGICNYRRVNWGKVPIMEKYYHCSKQCFIKRYSKCVEILLCLNLLKELKTYLGVN